jgi:homogentisate 1,2-dioxygenase
MSGDSVSNPAVASAAASSATPVTVTATAAAAEALRYQSGFGNHFATEALPGALPSHNSPQRCPFGLYAEQLSGTAFTAPRHANRRSWLYRIRPAVAHGPFAPRAQPLLCPPPEAVDVPPDQLRWRPLPLPQGAVDFVDGLVCMGGQGSPQAQSGCAIHLYAASVPMRRRAFYDADGELLIVPQLGSLLLISELGRLRVDPLEIAVIPRGVRFCVELPEGPARGYVCENFGAPLRLPDLGPIGSNGLACERDFQAPCAWYEDLAQPHELLGKFLGRLWAAELDHSPFDVVAWRGNYAPYKYDLRRFNAMGSIGYDHPDPSIFLVLQSISDTPGADALDFVVFPPCWLVMQDTFRPPWFHRNVASEFMGLIEGAYDAKSEGFLPGGASLHNCMSGHGPDAASFEQALRADTRVPQQIVGSMAFMFETRCVIRPTRYALDSPQRDRSYPQCWRELSRRFDPRSC